MSKSIVKQSKFLSLVLRHNPDKIGITLDKNGWVGVRDLLDKAGMSMGELEEIVATNNKKRFAFNEDKTKIRASQGHSVKIDLDLDPKDPPQFLYHGTATRFLTPIFKEGLKSGNRQHVHLSQDTDTAYKVGKRHGKPIILGIDTINMRKDGIDFYLSENGVWLTDYVDPKYITYATPGPDDEEGLETIKSFYA